MSDRPISERPISERPIAERPISERQGQIEDFLADVGWTGAAHAPLAGDASFRRYERVTLDGKTAVLMDAPPPGEDVGPFVRITRHLRDMGYSAPELLAENEYTGFLLLEDLGDATYTKALAAGADEVELYTRAVDLLINLHGRHPTAELPSGIETYSEQKLMEEAALFVDWYLPNLIGIPTDPIFRHEYEDIWRGLLAFAGRGEPTLVLRDFHADNLMWLPERSGIAACGLLDYQDAVLGSQAYDLMSLLEDARRDLRGGLAAHLLEHYRAAFPGVDWPQFQTVYTILAAQRHCKVIGIFTRLALRDDKYDYLGHIPRVWTLLDRACRHPLLARLKTWLDQHVPEEKRRSAMHGVSV
ncbi:MAG: phosphotransferase [Rhodospirillales bacterium]|nr:phosphotransferase [Rhodospirillales bacterium]